MRVIFIIILLYSLYFIVGSHPMQISLFAGQTHNGSQIIIKRMPLAPTKQTSASSSSLPTIYRSFPVCCQSVQLNERHPKIKKICNTAWELVALCEPNINTMWADISSLSQNRQRRKGLNVRIIWYFILIWSTEVWNGNPLKST